MSSPNRLHDLDEKLYAATRVPGPRPEFLASLRARLDSQSQRPAIHAHLLRNIFRRPAWITLVIVLILAAGILLAAGSQRVMAAVRQLFGYIPGVGIVDQSLPMRVLAAPVSLTRDGVTISINHAFLTPDKTQIDYGISDVPLSAYPRGEAVTGCIDPEYLRLPDGSHQDLNAPIPAGVNEAVFVMPCIFNTLPGTVPTGWELPLHFIPAPPDMTVLPVIELSPSPIEATLPPTQAASALATITPALSASSNATPTRQSQAEVVVEKVIETADGYILLGVVQPTTPQSTTIMVTGLPDIRDANGKRVNFTLPTDSNLSIDTPNGFSWTYAFKGSGLAFPLTLRFPGVVITPADPQASADFVFDAGPDPQPGQEWNLNQEIQLAGHTIKLVSIAADSRNGYSFHFESDAHVDSLSVEILGTTPNGGGGGGGAGMGVINTSLSFAELPKGKLTVRLSHLNESSDPQSWQGSWQPQGIRSDWPTATAAPFPLCLDADGLDQLGPVPANLTGALAISELSADGNTWSMAWANLDGSRKQTLPEAGVWSSLSLDRQRLAYSGPQGITIVDLASGKSTAMAGLDGYDLHWSPDGSQIAFMSSGGTLGLFVTRSDSGLDGANPRQLSRLGYESIAGWTPDGQQIYFAIPGAGGNGWQLRAVEVASGAIRDLFVLENSSAKAPIPTVSPDGNWIAYRSRDNASLYLTRMDGSQQHIILENAMDTAISGIAWNQDSTWLGVSLMTADDQAGRIILIQPMGCQAYLVPGLHGNIIDLSIP